MFCDYDLSSLICEENPTTPLNDEQKLYMKFFLEDYFEEGKTPNIFYESKTHQTNFDILMTKLMNGEQITDIELQQLPYDYRNILIQVQNKSMVKKKRSDECQKMFYKKAFKYSENKYFCRYKNKNKSKSRVMSSFYHHHFDEVVERKGLPITTFYHPDKKTKPGLAIVHKTFNTKYVKHLLLSKSFRNDVKDYHCIFREECQKYRLKKIRTFSSSLKEIRKKVGENPTLIIKHLQSSQCKIPWTDYYIQQCWELARRDLEDNFDFHEKYYNLSSLEKEAMVTSGTDNSESNIQ